MLHNEGAGVADEEKGKGFSLSLCVCSVSNQLLIQAAEWKIQAKLLREQETIMQAQVNIWFFWCPPLPLSKALWHLTSWGCLLQVRALKALNKSSNEDDFRGNGLMSLFPSLCPLHAPPSPSFSLFSAFSLWLCALMKESVISMDIKCDTIMGEIDYTVNWAGLRNHTLLNAKSYKDKWLSAGHINYPWQFRVGIMNGFEARPLFNTLCFPNRNISQPSN